MEHQKTAVPTNAEEHVFARVNSREEMEEEPN